MEKIALVTGAGRGIGKAIALELGEMGHPVAVNFRNSEGAAIELCREISENGGKAIAFKADVGDP
jgi:NAD(P)-dependent dehydrogenase (short-subunit alcohol dehydrogenase family)